MFEEVAVLDFRFDALEQIGHAMMLTQRCISVTLLRQFQAVKPLREIGRFGVGKLPKTVRAQKIRGYRRPPIWR